MTPVVIIFALIGLYSAVTLVEEVVIPAAQFVEVDTDGPVRVEM